MLDNLAYECEEAWADKHFIKKIKELKFDVVVINRFPLAPCYNIIPYYLSASYVSINYVYEPWLGGAPTLPPFTYNALFNYGNKTNFISRDLFISIFLEFDFSIRSYRLLLESYAPGVSCCKKLVDHSQMIFMSREHVLQWLIPAMPNVIVVPSLGCTLAKELPQNLQQIAISFKHGVIIVSFGSVANYLPDVAVRKMA